MDNLAKRVPLTVGVLAVSILMFASPAAATISIVGVDAEAGEVGIAVASCVPGSAVSDLSSTGELASLVPGVGAGISQALLNQDAPPEIARLLSRGDSPTEIIAHLTDGEFDEGFDDRQHAVVTLDGEAAGFSGAKNLDVALDIQADGVSVQGNILASEAVAGDALSAYQASDGRLAEKLVDALVAASAAGGDSRCAEQTALFAHVAVAGQGDDPQNPSVLMWVTVDEGSDENPILTLAENFNAGNDQVSVLNSGDLGTGTASRFIFYGLIVVAFVLVGLFVSRRLRRAA